jgi:ankyrin repeat protein
MQSSAYVFPDHTTQEYFIDRRQAQFPDAQAQITTACLTYLSFDIFGQDYSHNNRISSLLQDHALLDYAARNWGYHAHGQVEETCKNMVLKFLQDGSKVNVAGQILLDSSNVPYPGVMPRDPPKNLGMHVASCFGLQQTINYQLQDGTDPNAVDHYGRTALSYAAQNGHEAVVMLLLTWSGIEVNIPEGNCDAPLSFACANGHKTVVKLLLKKGADVNAQGGHFGNPLQAALYGGHKSIVKVLLENRADVHAQGGVYGNALQAASYKGLESIVKVILENRVDVNAQGGYYGNALQAASYKGHESIMKVLLEKGADVHAQGGHYSSALQAASNGGHDSILKLLLEKGADASA